MGTVCQLLALPACFLLVGLLGGGCRSLAVSLLRRMGTLMGADDAARVELLKRRRLAAVGFGRALVYGAGGAPARRAAPRKPAMKR